MNVHQILEKNIYTVEKNNMGHTIIIGCGLDNLPSNSNNIKLLTDHIISEITKSLNVSKKYNNTTNNVHIYLKNCTYKNINMSMYKKLVKTLNNTFEETLNCCYIYDLSNIGTCILKIIKLFLDPVTKKKIKMIKS